ncbi:scavenger receptor cysteine-rich type 1 protein M130-like [Discoglossus pictus]
MLLKTQLRWAGHISKMEGDRVAKIVLYGELTPGDCGRGGLKKSYEDSLKQYLDAYPRELKLVDGPNDCSGHLEVKHDNTWGSVCELDVELRAASVICRELGCGAAIQPRTEPTIRGTGNIWTGKIHCIGNETKLTDCLRVLRLEQKCTNPHYTTIHCVASTSTDVLVLETTISRPTIATWSDTMDALAGPHLSSTLNLVSTNLGYTTAMDDTNTTAHTIAMANTIITAPLASPLPQAILSSPQPIDSPGMSSVRPHTPSEDTLRGHMHHIQMEDESNITLMDKWNSSWKVRMTLKPLLLTASDHYLASPPWKPELVASSSHTLPPMPDATQQPQVGATLTATPPRVGRERKCTSTEGTYNGFRIVTSTQRCSGRVELEYSGQWGTLCSSYWDLQAANVLCQQLHCGVAVSVPVGGYFGAGRGMVWTDRFHCDGTESHLGFCKLTALGNNKCSEEDTAGVICTGKEVLVRLVDGDSHCAGRLELLQNGTWHRVLGDQWGIKEAEVVCRELHCGNTMATFTIKPQTPFINHVMWDRISCEGNETQLKDCSFAPPNSTSTEISQMKETEIICAGNKELRLVDGKSRCAGRVEVYHQGEWGTVCDDYWNQADADVVCRQLNCGHAITATIMAYHGRGNGKIWMDDVKCTGDEAALSSCPSNPKGQHNCHHKEDSGVICAESTDLRLVNGFDDCEGRLEVYYNGSWGSVCNNNMDRDIVSVICRQLNCGSTGIQEKSTDLRLVDGFDDCEGRLEVYYNGSWGSVCNNKMDRDIVSVICRQLNCGSTGIQESMYAYGVAPSNSFFWVDHIECRKRDETLWQCPSSSWTPNSCTIREVAEIKCDVNGMLAF